MKLESRRRQAANPELGRAKRKKELESRTPERLARQREYWKRRRASESPEARAKAKVNRSLWGKRHRAKLSADRKRWAEANPEKVRELIQVSAEKRRARKRNAGDGVSAAEWRKVLALYEGRCAYCNALARLTMDHVVPLSRGGRHEASNIVPACWPCNLSKGPKLLSEWRPGFVSRCAA